MVNSLYKYEETIQYNIVSRSRISNIELNNLTGKPVPASFLQEVAQNVLLKEKKKGMGLSLVIAEKKLMQTLNRQYRNEDKASNVLSFKIAEIGLGEVMLCPAEIRRDAKNYGISYRKAMAWMLIHGILHVLGYTHTQMMKKEKFYRSRIS